MKAVWSTLLIFATYAGSWPAAAHHLFAMFDASRRETLSGTVKAFEWSAPHVWIWVTTGDGNNGASTYGFECPDPHALARWGGWSKNSLSVGDKVTVDWHPLKSGQAGPSLISVTLADGRVLSNAAPLQPPPN